MDEEKSRQQTKEAQGTFISADFRNALLLEFNKAGAAPNKGLLAPQIDNLVQKVKDLETKLKANYAGNYDAVAINEELSKYIGKLIGKIRTSLEIFNTEQAKTPDRIKLTEANEIFAEHQQSVLKFAQNVEMGTELTVDIDEAMQNLTNAIRRLQSLLAQFSPQETPLEREDRERREKVEKSFDVTVKVAEQVENEIKTGTVLGTLDFRGPLTISYTDAAGAPANKLFKTPYHALAEAVFKLNLDKEYRMLEEFSTFDKQKAPVTHSTMVWDDAREKVAKIQDIALVGDGAKPPLAKTLFESDDLLTGLMVARATFSGKVLNGGFDYAADLATLKKAKQDFDADLVIPTGAEDPNKVFEAMKSGFAAEVAALIEKVEANQWLLNLKGDPQFRDGLQDLFDMAAEAEGLIDELTRNRKLLNLGIEESASTLLTAQRVSPELKYALDALKRQILGVSAGANADIVELNFSPIDGDIEKLNQLMEMETTAATMSKNVFTHRMVNYNGGGGGGFPFEQSDTLADQIAIKLYDAFNNKFGGYVFPAKVPRTPEDFENFQLRLYMLLGRLKGKLGDNKTPSASRASLEKQESGALTIIDLLNIGRQDVFEGIMKDPDIGSFFKQLLWRMTWTIGLKEGYAASKDGKLIKLAELARKVPPAYDAGPPARLLDESYVMFDSKYDYNQMISSSGKTNLSNLLEEQFATMLSLPEFRGNAAAISAKQELIDGLATTLFIGFNFLDKSLSLRQWFGEQTKSHDTGSKTNYGLLDNLFAAMLHNIIRYGKGMELTTAFYSIFYANMLNHPYAERLSDKDKNKIAAWQIMIEAYFKALNISLKGAKGEIDPLDHTKQKNGIPVPQWNDETFPSWETVLTDPAYNRDQKWADYQTSRGGWQAFIDFVAKPLPAKIEVDNVMTLIGDNMSESKVLGVAKLVKGPHWNHIPAMMTFKINEMVTKTRENGAEKIKLLKMIVARLGHIKEHGLKDLATQVQQVIDNIYGDRGWEGFDNKYRATTELENAEAAVDYLNIVEAFKEEHYEHIIHGTYKKEYQVSKPLSLRTPGQYRIVPPIADITKTPEARAKLLHETEELQHLLFGTKEKESVHPLDLPASVFPAPFGHTIASEEKVGSAHK
jgi:hypothetical protein